MSFVRVSMKLRGRTRLALVLFLPALLLTISRQAEAGAPAADAPTSVRQADGVCSTCHKAIFEKYLKTPMANASGLALDRWMTGSSHQTLARIDYKFFEQDGAAWMSFLRPTDPELTGKYKLSYFLGSGHLGLTYLYSLDGFLFQTPTAYYANLNGYDMKPGVADSPHMPPGIPMTSGCMRCHMSGVRREDAGTENHYTGLPFLHGGITCESCHGPTEDHVRTHGRAAVLNPVKLEPERRDSICISCHLEGDTHIEHRGKRALDFRPGDRIAEYMTFFQLGPADAHTRGVSEIEQLDQSMCKRTSGDRMSCMSCHDPHSPPSAEERAGFYRNKCLSCHTAPRFASAHFPANPDCTSCHMPKGGAENIPHVAWTDHRILRTPSELDTQAKSAGPAELKSILGDDPSRRDRALAYYDLVSSGNGSEKQHAFDALGSAAKLDGNDPEIHLALGVMLQWSRDMSAAEVEYRRVLQLDPVNLTAAVNLGTLVAQSGQLQAATEMWAPAFERNKDNPTLGNNLATVECVLGRKDEAVRILRTVLVFNPDEPKAQAALRAIEANSDSCPGK